MVLGQNSKSPGRGNGCCLSKKVLLRARAPFGHSFPDQLGCLSRKNVELGFGTGWKVGGGKWRPGSGAEGSSGSGPDCRHGLLPGSSAERLWAGSALPAQLPVELNSAQIPGRGPGTFTGRPQTPLEGHMGSKTWHLLAEGVEERSTLLQPLK